MRLFVFIVYGAFLGFGTYWIFDHRPTHGLVATKDLSMNHRLHKGEVVLNVEGGLYAVRSVKSGETVSEADFSTSPLTSLPKNHVPFSIPVPATAVANGVIEAGVDGLICPPRIATNIYAVFCESEKEACFAIGAVPAEKAKDLRDSSEGLTLTTGTTCE